MNGLLHPCFGKGLLQRVVEGNLNETCGEPDEEDKGCERGCGDVRKQRGTKRRVKRGERTGEFEEHGWEDNVSSPVGVEEPVALENVSRADVAEEWVMHDLYKPDKAVHEEGGRDLREEEQRWK